jgi:dihydrofolate reductase/thymidylate synthase
MINLIFSGVFFKNQFAIGKDNELLFTIPDDLKYFKTTTVHNVVLMGRKTWDSIPDDKKPLKNRINLVLTRDKLISRPIPKNLTDEKVYFTSYKQFEKFYKKNVGVNVFVIGGAEILNKFIDESLADKIYFTEINVNKQFVVNANVFVNIFNNDYKLISISEAKYFDTCSYRHLLYHKVQEKSHNEEKYVNLCKEIINGGEERNDRTLVGTQSIFGKQLHFDISQSIPLLTTKSVPWKHVIEELLWFMRGDTDSKILSKKGVRIWDGNTSRKFLDSRGLYLYDEGVLGKGYGWQWRFFGAKYLPVFADTSNISNRCYIGGFDQLKYVINELKTNKYSRRILMCYWNPNDLNETALPPCHYSCQFYVHDDDTLDCHFTMRSTDCGLGLPFNIVSYAIFTYIIAMKCNLKPGKLIYTGGDVHVYKNHIKDLLVQLDRDIRPEPHIIVNPLVKNKKIEEITINDFDLVGYFPHPHVKLFMAV